MFRRILGWSFCLLPFVIIFTLGELEDRGLVKLGGFWRGMMFLALVAIVVTCFLGAVHFLSDKNSLREKKG